MRDKKKIHDKMDYPSLKNQTVCIQHTTDRNVSASHRLMLINEEPPRVRGVRTGLIPEGLFRLVSWS